MPSSGIAIVPSDLKSEFLDGLHPSHRKTILSAATLRRFSANSVATNLVSRRLASPTFADRADTQAPVHHRHEETIVSSSVPLLVKREVGRCHEVQFYSDDSRFLDGFTRFLGAALKTGNPAVFIGTESHRNTLLERLHALSPDIRTAIRQGRYVPLDAVEFLSNFMVNDMPDPGWFLKSRGRFHCSGKVRMESICASQPAVNAHLSYGHRERQMLRFDSRSSGTKLPGHMTLIFSAVTRWKAFAAKKTVTLFVESVKNTQLSISDDRSVKPCDWRYCFCKRALI